MKLKNREYLFLKFLSAASRKNEEIRGAKKIAPALLESRLIAENQGVVSITEAGEKTLSECGKILSQEKAEEVFLNVKRIQIRMAQMEKAELFLTLLRQGNSYQNIGDLHGITRMRVSQIIRNSPNFALYKQARKKESAKRELEEKDAVRLKVLEKSLAHLFPDCVNQLWDWEKNRDLNPALIPAHSARTEIWLRCPKDGYSWKRKPVNIVMSWKRGKISGCPACTGRVNKPLKQKLTEAFPEYVEKYWDSEANNEVSLDPAKLTLGCNYKARFKCPIDGNQWSALIFATVKKWSAGDSGCQVCKKINSGRKLLEEAFPEYTEKYWDSKKNSELSLDLKKLSSWSKHKAWFRCPIDDNQWCDQIRSIAKKWKKDNSGCRVCKKNGMIKNLSASK